MDGDIRACNHGGEMDESKSTKRRRPRIDGVQTREAILKAAEIEFAAKGYDLASARAICAKAGVNIALISRYFGGKAGLYHAVAERLFGNLSKPMLNLASGVSNEADWRRAVEVWVDDFLYMTSTSNQPQRRAAQLFRHEATHPSKFAAELKATFGKDVYDSLHGLLELAGLRGDDLELWTGSIWSQVAVYALADRWWMTSFMPNGVSLDEWSVKVKDHILRGIFAQLSYKGGKGSEA